ncbi:MAG: hypothetical protein IJY12_01930 [Clostridia bacterium]|nr:hypothetical protein [Clostridia bacterium]
MKKIVAILLCVVFVATLGACAKDYGYDYYNYDLSEYITIENYKNLDIVIYTKTRDSEKQEVIDYYTAYYATADTAATVAEGDTISVTYTCTVDGTKVDAESATSTYVKLGNDTLLPEVEAALIGKGCETPILVEATFPADYESDADVAGKTATFEVTVNSVMVDAEYNDEFVATYFADYGVSTMAEFDEYMNHNYLLNAIMDALMSDPAFKVIGYPEKELNQLVEDQCAYEDSMYQSYYGFTLEEVLESSGMSLADYKKSMAEDESILSTMKGQMIYHHIIRAEGLTTSDEEAQALQTQLINENLAYYQSMYESAGITGTTLNSYLADVLATLKSTYTIENCKLSSLFDLAEELLMNSQNVNYVDDFDPSAETTEDTSTGETSEG